MRRIIKFFSFLTIVVLTITIVVACNSRKDSAIFSNDNIDITYKYGKIEFVDELMGDIYSEKFSNDDYSGFFFVSIQPDSLVYTFNTYKYLPDYSDAVLELCRDSVCDHSVKESCIQSFGNIYYVVCTSDYTYFTKGNGVYRYSIESFTTEPYAVFNATVTNQFLMGKYLYIEIAASVYVKVDLESGKAVILENIGAMMSCIYPYNGQLYFLDEANNIYICDDNFVNKKLLVTGRHFDCAIQASFQPFEDSVYYIDKGADEYNLCRYDLKTEKAEKLIDDVFAFCISPSGRLFYQKYDPSVGPLYNNGSEYVNVTCFTGKTIYYADLDDAISPSVFIKNEFKETRLGESYMFATEKYLYVYIDEFNDGEMEMVLYRINCFDPEWQRVAGENEG